MHYHICMVSMDRIVHLKRALATRKPEIINSDQGSHFTNPDYIQLLEENQVRISMDGKGQCLDNTRTERFFRTLKYDRIYVNEYLHGNYVQCSTNTWQSTTPIGHIQALAANALRRPTSKTGLSLLSLVNTCRKEHNLAFLNSCLDNGVQYIEGISKN